jgi:hypothetical protein
MNGAPNTYDDAGRGWGARLVAGTYIWGEWVVCFGLDWIGGFFG